MKRTVKNKSDVLLLLCFLGVFFQSVMASSFDELKTYQQEGNVTAYRALSSTLLKTKTTSPRALCKLLGQQISMNIKSPFYLGQETLDTVWKQQRQWHPNDECLGLEYGVYLASTGREKLALRHLETTSLRAERLRLLAEIYWETQNYRAIEAKFKKNKNERIRMLYLLSISHLGRFEKAKALAQKWSHEEPGQILAWETLLRLVWARGTFQEKIVILETIGAIEATHPLVKNKEHLYRAIEAPHLASACLVSSQTKYYARAQSGFDALFYQETVSYIEDALEKNKDAKTPEQVREYIYFQVLLARTQERLQADGQAEQTWKALLKYRAPKFDKGEQQKEVRKLLERSQAYALVSLGQMYWKRYDWNNAKIIYIRLARLKPYSAFARAHLNEIREIQEKQAYIDKQNSTHLRFIK